MYGLSDEDLQIQARARTYADEMIPFEVTAEMNHGELPKETVAEHAARARELGLCATNMPTELGGGGCTTLQQVLVQEQVGRVTNGLAWACSTPPSWMPERGHDLPDGPVRDPGDPRRPRGVLRDHRGGRRV